jgi:hypothetical protein
MNGNINEFLGAYDLPKLDQEDIRYLNSSIMNNEIETAIITIIIIIIKTPNKEQHRIIWICS